MPCFVNLPLRWIYKQPLWATWFIDGRISPEFGLDEESLRLSDSWHATLAARFRDAGLQCAVHLPFMGVDPADLDDAKARQAREHLKRGAELANLYGARHMIGHPYYRPPRNGREEDTVAGRWMGMSLAAWAGLPDIGNATLFLENTYERSPKPIATLVTALNEGQSGGCDSPGIGVCFDLGHWHAFAGLSAMEDFASWLDAFSPHRLHLHLHDNDGTADHHLGLGKGTVPLEGAFAVLESRGKAVTATLEPHDTEAFVASVFWLEQRQRIATALAWVTPILDAMPFGEITKALQSNAALPE